MIFLTNQGCTKIGSTPEKMSISIIVMIDLNHEVLIEVNVKKLCKQELNIFVTVFQSLATCQVFS